MNSITLKIPNLSHEGFQELCKENNHLQLERSSTGEIIVLPPTHPWTGQQNSGITAQLWVWNERTELGITFDSSTGFTLRNGAVYSPDASWIETERWNALTPTQQQKEFSAIAPDFVVELRSSSDSLKKLQQKMQEYIDNGVLLGWLIDTKNQNVEIYRSGKEVEVLDSPMTISGEDILPGFELNLQKIW
jgi:Uma2 family endonuclease